MKNLLLLAISLPLLLGGCGEKATVEPVVEAKPEVEGVNVEELKERLVDGIFITYYKGSDTPYTGKIFNLYKSGKKEMEANYKDGKPDGLLSSWYEDGQKKLEGNYKDGKLDGLRVWWHENGQKSSEVKYKDNRRIRGSEKYWNSKGEPVGSLKEAKAEYDKYHGKVIDVLQLDEMLMKANKRAVHPKR